MISQHKAFPYILFSSSCYIDGLFDFRLRVDVSNAEAILVVLSQLVKACSCFLHRKYLTNQQLQRKLY